MAVLETAEGGTRVGGKEYTLAGGTAAAGVGVTFFSVLLVVSAFVFISAFVSVVSVAVVVGVGTRLLTGATGGTAVVPAVVAVVAAEVDAGVVGVADLDCALCFAVATAVA
jgi:hypothetical protein